MDKLDAKETNNLKGQVVDAMPSCVGDAMPSVVGGCCVLEFLFGRFFAFFNVLSYFFGQFVDTGHVQSAALALHYP